MATTARIVVVLVMSVSGSASSRTKSASFPGATVPSESVACRNFAGLSVAVCKASNGVRPSAT
ncbi:hypothetical protein D3C83_110440 [compost metagenome]